MMTTATRHEHDNTPAEVLFMAFVLSEKTWNLGGAAGTAAGEDCGKRDES
jgi:hypothetical protein